MEKNIFSMFIFHQQQLRNSFAVAPLAGAVPGGGMGSKAAGITEARHSIQAVVTAETGYTAESSLTDFEI